MYSPSKDTLRKEGYLRLINFTSQKNPNNVGLFDMSPHVRHMTLLSNTWTIKKRKSPENRPPPQKTCFDTIFKDQ